MYAFYADNCRFTLCVVCPILNGSKVSPSKSFFLSKFISSSAIAPPKLSVPGPRAPAFWMPVICVFFRSYCSFYCCFSLLSMAIFSFAFDALLSPLLWGLFIGCFMNCYPLPGSEGNAYYPLELLSSPEYKKLLMSPSFVFALLLKSIP